VRIGDETGPSDRFVVCHGVRHVAIDVLPREVVTFRCVCGRDVVDDGEPAEPPTDCASCRLVDRTWLLVKATEVI